MYYLGILVLALISATSVPIIVEPPIEYARSQTQTTLEFHAGDSKQEPTPKKPEVRQSKEKRKRAKKAK
jgi:hypothetical protein